MANPWEQKNRWGKGTAAWNKWMDPEAEIVSTASFIDDPIVGYFDENAMRFGRSKSMPDVVRMISRAEYKRISGLKADIEVKRKLLIEKSKVAAWQSAGEQIAFALDLLKRSTERGIELVAYVGYDFAKGRMQLVEEKVVEGNTIAFSHSHSDWSDEIPIHESVTGQKIQIHYVAGTKGSIQIIGIIHTHPSGGNSVFSSIDLLSANRFGGSIFAIQQGKILKLDAGDFAVPGEHLITSGDFDFCRYCLKTFSNGKDYRP